MNSAMISNPCRLLNFGKIHLRRGCPSRTSLFFRPPNVNAAERSNFSYDIRIEGSKLNDIEVPETFFIAVYVLLIHRYFQIQDISLNFQTESRPFSVPNETIGYFLNSLPIRLFVDPNSTFEELHHSVQLLVSRLKKTFQYSLYLDE